MKLRILPIFSAICLCSSLTLASEIKLQINKQEPCDEDRCSYIGNLAPSNSLVLWITVEKDPNSLENSPIFSISGRVKQNEKVCEIATFGTNASAQTSKLECGNYVTQIFGSSTKIPEAMKSSPVKPITLWVRAWKNEKRTSIATDTLPDAYAILYPFQNPK